MKEWPPEPDFQNWKPGSAPYNWVVWIKVFQWLFVSVSPICEMGLNNSTSLITLLWRLSESIFVKQLEQSLVYSKGCKCLINKMLLLNIGKRKCCDCYSQETISSQIEYLALITLLLAKLAPWAINRFNLLLLQRGNWGIKAGINWQSPRE